MKIEPSQGATINSMPTAKSEPVGISARDRAIAKLLTNPAQSTQKAEIAPSIAPEAPKEAPNPFEKAVAQAKASLEPAVTEGQIDTNVGASTPTESPTAETKVSEGSLSSHYAILARKEKAFRQREQQLKAKEQAMRAQEEAARAPAKPAFDESKYISKESLMANPFGVLTTELGLSYDQLTDSAMNAPKPEHVALVNQVKALKAEIDSIKSDTEKSFEQREQAQRTEALNQIGREVKSLVNNDPQYETIKATNNSHEVLRLIEKTFDQDGYLMTVEDAAQAVEDHLVEQVIAQTKLKKIQQRLQPKAAAPVETKTTAPQQSQQPLKTLTNSVASTRQLSARERAILAFKGEKY